MKRIYLFAALLALMSFNTLMAQSADDFVTTWKTDNPGSSNSTSITIPTTGGGYMYDVDWDNDGTFDEFGLTGNATHDFMVAGTYTIRIQGDFPRIYFNNGGDKQKLLSVGQWGAIAWTSMEYAFYGCNNLAVNATDAPDLSGVTEMNYMFRGCSSFNQNINHWDVSNVTSMRGLFWSATAFNQPLNNWDVGNVTNLSSMFQDASSFNQDIGSWDVSQVTGMGSMFMDASSFNQDIGSWNTGNVEFMHSMFHGATSFNQDIGGWNTLSLDLTNNMFNGVTLSVANYDQLLTGWSALNLQPGVTFHAGSSQYCQGSTSRCDLINNHGWSISDQGKAPGCNTLLLSCPANVTTVIDANACGAVVNYTVTYGGDCAGESLSQISGLPSGAEFPVGTTTNSFEVTVMDNEAPTAVCQDVTVQLDASGNGSTTATAVNNGSSDACGIASTVLDNTDFSCVDVGANTVTLTVTDVNSNTATCTATVTVEDNVAPVATCQDVTVQLDATGSASLTAGEVNNGSFDGEGPVTLSASPTDFTCANVGANTVTLSVTDGSGNSANCMATVTVENTTFPNSCDLLSKQIVSTSESGSPETGDGSSGNERPVLIGETATYKLVLEVPEGALTNVIVTDQLPDGLEYVSGSATFTSVSNNGLSYSTTVSGGGSSGADVSFLLGSITNTDNDADVETIEIQFDALVLNEPGNQSGALLSNSATLYFGASLISTSESRTVRVTEPMLQVAKEQRAFHNGPFITGGDAGDEYVYTVRVTNTGDAPAYDVRLSDFIPKDYVAQYGTLITTGLFGFGFTFNSTTGEWNYNWTEIGTGQSVSATLRIRVKDTVRPLDSWDNTVDITYTSLPGAVAGERTGLDGPGGALNDYAASATSAAFTVPEPEVAKQVEHPSETPLADIFGGAYTDSSSDPNTNTSQFTSDVDAAIGETFSYIITVTFPEGTTADFTMIDLISPNGHTGGRQNRVLDMLSAEVIHVGANLSGGGIETVGTMFTIEDSSPADGDGTRTQLWFGGGRDVLNTPDNVVDDNDRYLIRITARMDDEDETRGPADDVPGKSNNAGDVTGNRLQYQWRKSDNTQFTRQLVADVEVVEPAIALTKTVTAINGNGTVSGGNLSDALPGDEVTFTFTLNNNGTAPAYDVSFSDIFDPVFDLISVNTNSGTDNSNLAGDQASVSISSIAAGSSVTITAVVSIRNTAPAGTTYTNTAQAGYQSQPGAGLDIRAYNATGQASVAITDCLVTIATVSVTDEGCPNAGDGAINVTASTTTNNALTYTLSGPVNLSNANAQFTGLPDGVYSLSVLDDGIPGCSATQTDIIIAAGIDNTPPSAVCQNVTVQLDATGSASVTATQVNNGSSDNCGIASLSVAPNAFNCANTGTNTAVTLTVADVNGNSATCSATVTVEDNIAPTAVCQDVTVQLDANGSASVTAAQVNNGSSDNCGIASLAVSPSTFDCGDIGPNTVTLTVTDVNGNSSSCTASVSVEDNIPPDPVCLTNTVFLDPSGQYTLLDTDVLDFNATTDNCVEFFVSAIDVGTFDCDDAGQTFTVPVTVSDGSGNTAGCSATITVEVGKALPAPWASQDVGNPGTGNTNEFDPCALPQAFTIGAGAVNNSPGGDNMAFIEQQLCGDFEISVQVLSITPNGYAGLMARESGAPGSKMFGVYSNHSSMVRLESRSTTNGPKVINFFQKPAPYWLKLVRQGNWFFAYYSLNGVNYSIVTAQQLSMNSCLDVGLAAFSNIPGSTATAAFANVNLSSGGLPLVELPGNVVEQGAASRTISVFPNPFTTQATIRYFLPEASEAVLEVFNLAGQLVWRHDSGWLEAGSYDYSWDGAAAYGQPLDAGLYLVRLRVGDSVLVKRVSLAR